MRVFSLRDLCSLTGEARVPMAMTLARAARKGIVASAGRQWINTMDPPDLLDLALALESPSYLSFESALYRHGILSQSPRGAMTMATTRRPREHRTPIGTIRYFHLKPSLFFGYDERRIALPGKAWLDLLYIRGRSGGAARMALPEELDLEMLGGRSTKRMSQSFPSWVRGGLLDLGTP